MRLTITLMEDYDHSVKLGGETVFCYSQKQLDEKYPDGGYRIIGEAAANNKKKILSELQLRKTVLNVCQPGEHSSLWYRRAGYVRVGEENYVALLKPRWPLLLILLAAVVLILLICLWPGKTPGGPDGPVGPDDPVVINPDRPLPTQDSNAEGLEGDNSQKADAPEGGGSLSLIYTLEASVNLSTGEVGIYFKNPNASTHNVALDLYLISDGQEYLLAQSGLLEAGFGLNKLTLVENAPQLSEGIYAGLYRLHCYDPATGAQAMITPEITGLNVTVTK